jgi:Transposase DDE domain
MEFVEGENLEHLIRRLGRVEVNLALEIATQVAAGQTEQFKGRMQQRNAIEGTISELARAHGLRRSRYRGFAKVELQNLFIGTACNVKRWLRIVAEAKIGSNSHLLAFRNALYRIRRLFWALRLNSGSFSCPSQEPPFLTRV